MRHPYRDQAALEGYALTALELGSQPYPGDPDPDPDPGAAAYARCAEECRERQAGEPECRDACLRTDEARRKA